jgi:hypothetical protein
VFADYRYHIGESGSFCDHYSFGSGFELSLVAIGIGEHNRQSSTYSFLFLAKQSKKPLGVQVKGAQAALTNTHRSTNHFDTADFATAEVVAHDC